MSAESALEKNWGAEEWRKPKAEDDDVELRSEWGRIAFHIDYRSHWFVLVKKRSFYALVVTHGGGQERIQLPVCNGNKLAELILSLSSDDAYLLMHHLFTLYKDASRDSRDRTAAYYQKAFADGALKKRKIRGEDRVRIWIERPAILKTEAV